MNAAHDFLSFEKLLEQVADTRNARVPTARKLKMSGTSIIQEIETVDWQLSVYASGYYLYRSGHHATVGSVHACCQPMYYHCANGEEKMIPVEVFGKLPYQIRLIFEGESRIEENLRFKGNHHSPYCDEVSYTEQDDFTDSILDKLKLEDVRLTMSKLPSRRCQILEMHFFQGLSRQEIAISLGISRQAVDKHIHAGQKQLKELCESDDNGDGNELC